MAEQISRLGIHRQLHDMLGGFFYQNLAHRYFHSEGRQRSIKSS